MKSIITLATAITLLSLNLHASFLPSWLDKCQMVESPAIFVEGWHKLPQVQFWKAAMSTSSDSFLINDPQTRRVLATVSRWDWEFMGGAKRAALMNNIRRQYGVARDVKLSFTEGRKEFYDPTQVLPDLGKAIEVFQMQGVDPWFAQAILLIESPGRLAHSEVGAYGPYQLMPSIARAYGLQVSQGHDERSNIVRASQAAARLIKEGCVPQTARLLQRKGIPFHQDDLWFKLLALHVYHAGIGNVSKAMHTIPHPRSGMELLTELWQAEAGGFKNASQNYGQVAVAALLQLRQVS